MKFKNAGVRCLESFDGDILLTDYSLKHDMIITREEFKKAERNINSAYKLICRLKKYFERHIDLRWTETKKQLIEIAKIDKSFVRRKKDLIRKGDIAALKKLEKDIYFYSAENQPTIIINKQKDE